MAIRLVLLLVLGTCSWAQLKFDIRPVVGRASDRLLDIQRDLQVARQSVWREAKAQEERAVLEAVVQTYRLHFQTPIDSLTRIATLTDKGQDILVARWVATGSNAFTELIAWDTPSSTS